MLEDLEDLQDLDDLEDSQVLDVIRDVRDLNIVRRRDASFYNITSHVIISYTY